MPAELAPTLLRSLSEDLEWSYAQVQGSSAKTSGSAAAAGASSKSTDLGSSRYTHFLASFPCYRDRAPPGGASAAGASASGTGTSDGIAAVAAPASTIGDIPGHPGVQHLHFDEALLCRHAISSVLILAQAKRRK